MKPLLALSRIIDTVNRWIGATVIWFVLAAVLISAGNAVLRKLFNIGSNAYLELQWYLFAAVFLLGAAYTFLRSRRSTAAAALSLMPLTLLLIWLSWPLVVNAYVSGEMSQNAGGLIRWPVYALLPAGMALLFAQSVSELIKRIAFLRGAGPDSIPEEHDPTAASLVSHPSEAERTQ